MLIFWTATWQHIGLVPGESASYLSPFLINFYRGMGLLTSEERRKFLLQIQAQEEEEVVSANEVDTNPKDEPISLPPQRRERPRG